jgi:hypothetical protein
MVAILYGLGAVLVILWSNSSVQTPFTKAYWEIQDKIGPLVEFVVNIILPSVLYIISPATFLPEGTVNKFSTATVLSGEGFKVILLIKVPRLLPELVSVVQDNNVVSLIALKPFLKTTPTGIGNVLLSVAVNGFNVILYSNIYTCV